MMRMGPVIVLFTAGFKSFPERGRTAKTIRLSVATSTIDLPENSVRGKPSEGAEIKMPEPKDGEAEVKREAGIEIATEVGEPGWTTNPELTVRSNAILSDVPDVTDQSP